VVGIMTRMRSCGGEGGWFGGSVTMAVCGVEKTLSLCVGVQPASGGFGRGKAGRQAGHRGKRPLRDGRKARDRETRKEHPHTASSSQDGECSCCRAPPCLFSASSLRGETQIQQLWERGRQAGEPNDER
jgi:hypothetical protein